MNITNSEAAVYVKLGWLEVSAFGELAIVALVFLATLLIGARIFLLTYRSGPR